MKKYYLSFLLLFISFPQLSVAQTFSFDYGETSADVDLGTYVQFEGSITNTTDSLITIAVVKNVNEIPDGWASMICIGNLCYPPYVDSVTADIVGIDYSVSIQPIFNQSCTGCHDGSNPAGGLNLLSYEDLMSNNVIVPGDHEASELYDRITRPESSNGNMPPAGSLGQDEIDLIADWIDEGALNGEKTADFSLDVVVQETEGIGNIQIALLDVAYPEEAVTVDYTVSTTQSEMTLTVDHLIDWNMVGLPLVVEDGNVSTIFPDAINGTLYSFGVSYILEETLENGKGYWLRFDDSGSSDITGGEITSLTMSMNEGWNLISGISSTIFLENILDPWEIIIDGTLYGYNGSYLYTESLVPGEGYWLRTNDEGDITLSSSQQSARAVSSADRLDRSNRLEFANGNYTNTLYFGENIPDETRLSYSLPPVFPYMAFDARFTDNMRNTEDGGKIQVINTNSSLNIHYNIMINAGEQKEWILATGVGEEYVLTGAGEITLPGGSQEMTLGKRTILPDNYTLHQNYPNPFNPVTTLRYSLPFYDHVTLTIYDLSGREINQIVNTSQPAGFQSVVWNATDYFGRSVGAGVYLYQIQAGDFKDTKKMVLLK
ncbi:MAG TPA: c-type cytochrome domain-containing protein [Candidatus Marinimicrobia bacterium]|jgi:hypothetical protein|nr:hypothetical protein [Candidatus Neomarinimicrobiota bacterium]MDP6142537.1 c-type cytochrome domain-containing protein [Candidatus Neomarinimicrobiota bacterium]MDP6261564.1 c-type cytochrome domain-containing protein [Candidatus Neomarinimicrobiota bacterium]MDP7128564.1 c-type cytochrome domain-containing protein [Candidatus Neomarinimicrobiota bacterium]MDP7475873.1 c-type cytochrome domain-containing protein [Candidatus Neomarinimicrobiota bacterium]|tara:strand:+ start:2287 stop:4095 length:1809 start_codon:yes stop_codon:yes gene_type:complete